MDYKSLAAKAWHNVKGKEDPELEAAEQQFRWEKENEAERVARTGYGNDSLFELEVLKLKDEFGKKPKHVDEEDPQPKTSGFAQAKPPVDAQVAPSHLVTASTASGKTSAQLAAEEAMKTNKPAKHKNEK